MEEAAINRATSETVASYPRIWFVPADGGVRDPGNAVTRWLDYHLLHEQYYQFDGLALRAYRPVETVPDVAHPLSARWAGALDLQAVYLTQNGAPVPFNRPLQLQSGDELAVTLLWHTHQKVETNYVVFVHLLNEGGQLLAQHDGVPLYGTRPTSAWQRGEMLLDRHVLEIEEVRPAMEARLVTGLYDPTTLEQIPLSGETTRLPLFPEPITILPDGE
jgi:hypothetical protein